VIDHTVSSDRFSVDIKRGCDAVQPTVLFISAVLASPVGFLSKLPGLAIGFFFLMAMNLVRVISLFYIGIHLPSWFDMAHHDIWQATFIILSILAWALWAIWAVRRTPLSADASS
jgi:exosortase/archaeosortase family protein